MSNTQIQEYSTVKIEYVLIDFITELLVLVPFMLIAKSFPFLGMNAELYMLFVCLLD